MRAGALRHPIVIEEVTSEARDAVGGVTPTWTTFASPWSAVQSGAGREFFAAKERHGTISHLFIIRQLDGITPKMRVSFDGRVFDILSAINVDERDRATHIATIEHI